MVGFWISFWIIAAVIIIGFVISFSYIKTLVKRNNDHKSDKLTIIMLIKSNVLYLLADLFYMSIFTDNLVLQFIFGGTILMFIYINLGYAFSTPIKKSAFARIGLIMDFVIGIGLTIYLLFIIPNKDLQSIMVPIIAAIYGGLLTLTGVAWTIRWSVKNKENDEMKDLVPLVFIANYDDRNDSTVRDIWIVDKLNKGNLLSCGKGEGAIHFNDFRLANSDHSYCTFRGISINGVKNHWFDHGKAMDKKERDIISLGNYFEFKENIESIFLLLEDMRDNLYLMEVEFEVHDFDSEGTKSIVITGGYRPVLADPDFEDWLDVE